MKSEAPGGRPGKFDYRWLLVDVEFPEGPFDAIEEHGLRHGFTWTTRFVRTILFVLQKPGAVFIYLP